MFKEVLYRDIYEIRTIKSPINGVILRGRLRKLCLEIKQNILAENSKYIEKSVRFALSHGENQKNIISYLQSILSDVTIELILKNIANPVLSKIKVNKEVGYTIGIKVF